MHLGVSKRDVTAYDGDTKLNISISMYVLYFLIMLHKVSKKSN